MKNTFLIKKIILIILLLLVVMVIAFNMFPKKVSDILEVDNSLIVNENVIIPEKPLINKLCYLNSDKTESGFYDTTILKLNISGDNISGEFNYLQAEKDSKVGTIAGTVGPLIQNLMERKATVWWNSFGEGMNVKEELSIEFGDGSATVGFGEMVDRGDGVYIYKDKDNLTYIKTMGQIDCDTLNEKLSVEKYIKENIETIATNPPVLGGSWYTTTVFVNSLNKTGEVTYEDGHIQSKASFIYDYTYNPENINITDFKVIQ